MKTIVVTLLALSLMMPFALRSQQEGVKGAPGRQSAVNQTQYASVTQELGPLQEPAKPGGATGDDLFYTESGMYLEPGWIHGQVMLIDNSVIDDILLRYDIYHQQLQFIRETDTLAFANPAELMAVYLDEKRFIYTAYEAEGVIRQGYFEVLTDGECQLLLRRKVKYLVKAETRPAMDEDLYIREHEYFIRKSNDQARPVKVCRKSVLCAFQDKEQEIKGFMRENKLKMKTCDELQQVVEFYNNLTAHSP